MFHKTEPGTFCPLVKKQCIKHECSWFMLVRGKNPQTGEDVDNWGCAISWLPVLMVENSQQQRQTGAAVESFRNEMVNANSLNLQLQAAAIQQHLLQEGVRDDNA